MDTKFAGKINLIRIFVESTKHYKRIISSRVQLRLMFGWKPVLPKELPKKFIGMVDHHLTATVMDADILHGAGK